MARRYAYQCELFARSLDGTYEAILATYRATTPRLAARWARTTACRYAELLASRPAAPYLDPSLTSLGETPRREQLPWVDERVGEPPA